MPKGTAFVEAFGTDVSNGWGAAWLLSSLGDPFAASDWQVSGGVGTMSVANANTARLATRAGFNESDVDWAVTGSSIKMAVGAPIEVLNVHTRGGAYLFRCQLETDNSVTVLVIGPGGTHLDEYTIDGLTYASGMKLRMRVQSIGSWHRLKLWRPDVQTQPPFWHLSVRDDAGTTAPGTAAIRAGVAFGNTNSKPIVIQFDDIESVQVPDYATDRVPVQVLWAPGADLSADHRTWPWQDSTADVRQANPVTITMGRGDEASTTQPAGCGFVLNNPGKAYSAYHPGSPNYPYVRRNTPIWVLAGPSTRFFGYANGFVPSTLDQSAKVPVVSVSASGMLRRLKQGSTPLRSALYSAITASNPIAHYPLEDGVDSTQAASGLPGGTPMVVDTGIMDFIDAGPVGSAGAAQPDVDASNNMTATIVGGSATEWQASIWFRGEPSDNTTEAYFVPLEVRTDDGRIYRMAAQWETNGITVTAGILRYESEAATVESASVTLDPSVVVMDGNWHLYQATLRQSGSDISVVFRLDGKTSNSLTWPGFTLGRPVRVDSIGRFGGLGVSLNAKNLAVAHVGLWNTATLVDQYDAGLGYVGETATDRLKRLCEQSGVPLTTLGDSITEMGPQSVDTLLNLLRECEAADLGLLLDGLNPGLTYIPRARRYNIGASLTLDAAQQQVAAVKLADDDQRNRNLWEVKRKNGSSATFVDKTGPLGTDAIGVYDDSKTINIKNDARLQSYAAWLVWQGTREGFRYTGLGLNLRNVPSLVDDWLATPINGRLDVLSLADTNEQYPPSDVELLLEGYTETLAPFAWEVTGNVSPFESWRVATVADPNGAPADTDARVDSESTTLAAAVTAGASSLLLQVNAGRHWTTAAVNFPLWLDVGGYRVKATAITGTSNPQTATVDSATVTDDIPTGATVRVWRPAAVGL